FETVTYEHRSRLWHQKQLLDHGCGLASGRTEHFWPHLDLSPNKCVKSLLCRNCRYPILCCPALSGGLRQKNQAGRVAAGLGEMHMVLHEHAAKIPIRQLAQYSCTVSGTGVTSDRATMFK